MDYQEQADEFLKKTGTEFKAEKVGTDFFFDDDKEKRDIYRITLRRGEKKYSFRFGQSLNHSSTNRIIEELDRQGYSHFSLKMRAARALVRPPTAYDVLAAITKNDPGTLDNFADEYGYREVKPSRLNKIYASVVEEWENVNTMFHDVMDQLKEVE